MQAAQLTRESALNTSLGRTNMAPSPANRPKLARPPMLMRITMGRMKVVKAMAPAEKAAPTAMADKVRPTTKGPVAAGYIRSKQGHRNKVDVGSQ
jgi:hypothetical protein